METIRRLALAYDIRALKHAPKFGEKFNVSIAEEAIAALRGSVRPWDWRPTPGVKPHPAEENAKFDDEVFLTLSRSACRLSTRQIADQVSRNYNAAFKSLLRLEKAGRVEAIRTTGAVTHWLIGFPK